MSHPAVGALNRAKWEQVKLLFSAALKRTAAEREAFLRQVCASDSSLYHQVALLLSNDEAAGSFLRSPTAPPVDTALRDAFAEGDLAGRRFRILGLLGRGGMGEVYEAGDLERNVKVALKTLPRLDGPRLYRFKQEFRALAGITHPNLVNMYELVGEDDRWFFTMEFLDGQDLLACVGDLERLRAALAQVARGLIALHASGKLHCDVKPSNVIVTTSGRAVVLDFGLAIGLKDAASGRPTAGTVAYMSPEQAAGEHLAESSDWYSFGVMLFQSLTGALPFEGPAQQVMRAKQEEDAPPASALAPQLPPDLEDLCARLLRRDPSMRPSGNEVLDCLERNARAAPARPRGDESFFIGRQRELDLLADAYELTKTPQLVVAFVHGHSGAGKSALVEHYLSSVSSAVILSGRCYEQESVPYKAIDDSIDALTKYLATLPVEEQADIIPKATSVLAQLFPVLRQLLIVEGRMSDAPRISDAQELRRHAFRDLRRLLERVAHRQPVVIYIDDLHWGDLDGALLLQELMTASDPAPILLICAYRREEAERSSCVTTLLESADRYRVQRIDIAVDPLSPEESGELARKLLGPGEAARSERIARESGGNAYFIRELVQRSGDLDLGSDSLTALIAARIAGLPEPSRRVLEIVALHGRPLAQADAFAAADFDHRSPATIAPLRAGNLVRIAGVRQSDEIATFHDKIRETVVDLIPSEVRRGYHRGLAIALESSNRGDSETLAVHFAGAGESAKAGGYYLKAADLASASLAFERAARLYRMVFDQGAPLPEAEPVLRQKRAAALSNSGRGVEAANEFAQAARVSDQAARFALERSAAYHYCAGGYIDQGRAIFREVLGRVGLSLPESRASILFALLFRRLKLVLRGLDFEERSDAPAGLLNQTDAAYAAGAGLIMADQVCGMAMSSLSILLALKAGEPLRLVRSVMLEASNIAGEGWTGVHRSRRLLDLGHRVAACRDEPILHGWISMGEGGVAFLLGEWQSCVEHMQKAEAIFSDQCTGVVWELASARMLILYSLFNCGKLIEMSKRSPVLLREAEEREDLYSYATIATFSEPVVLGMADRPDEARGLVRKTLARWEQRARRGHHLQNVMGALTLMWMDFYDGRSDCPEDFLDEQTRLLKKHFFNRVGVLRVYYLDAKVRTALRRASRDPRYLRIAEKAVSELRQERRDLSLAYAATGASGILLERGDRDGAIVQLEQAARHFDRIGMTAQFWSVRWRIGKIGGGSVAEAESWLRANGVADPERFSRMLTGYEAMP